jgi:hypothetical protein
MIKKEVNISVKYIGEKASDVSHFEVYVVRLFEVPLDIL